MENLTNNPGLQHIAEEIFWNLDNESLANCVKVNRVWKKILNPSFWLKKCTTYVSPLDVSIDESVKSAQAGQDVLASTIASTIGNFLSFGHKQNWVNQSAWTKVVDVTRNNTIFEEELAKKLKKIHESLEKSDFKRFGMEDCPIHWAAYYGHLDAIKVLISLFKKTSNNPNQFGMTPIHMAAIKGHADVVKLLAATTENPNSASVGAVDQKSPIYFAAMYGHTNVIKILAPLAKYINANRPGGTNETAAEVAARFNDIETCREIETILRGQYFP